MGVVRPSHAAPDAETIHISLDQFADATVDVDLNVVDSASLANLHSQSVLSQVTPFSAGCSLSPGPLNISVSVRFHLVPAAALDSGSITTGGTAVLTDGSADFEQFTLPLFVVDDPVSPTALVDVQSINDDTSEDLQAAGNVDITAAPG